MIYKISKYWDLSQCYVPNIHSNLILSITLKIFLQRLIIFNTPLFLFYAYECKQYMYYHQLWNNDIIFVKCLLQPYHS